MLSRPVSHSGLSREPLWARWPCISHCCTGEAAQTEVTTVVSSKFPKRYKKKNEIKIYIYTQVLAMWSSTCNSQTVKYRQYPHTHTQICPEVGGTGSELCMAAFIILSLVCTERRNTLQARLSTEVQAARPVSHYKTKSTWTASCQSHSPLIIITSEIK